MAARTVARPLPRTRVAAGKRGRRLSWPWLTGGAILALALVLATAVALRSRGGGESEAGGAIATLNTADFHSLAFSPADPSVVYFGHHNGVMRSSDGGKTWSALVARSNFDGMSLAVSPADPRRMYLAGHDVFQASSDAGATWQPVANNLPGTDIHGFAMSPADPNRLFAFVVGKGTFHSADGGMTWQRSVGQPPSDVMILTVGGTPETIYAGSMRMGVLRSSDGGQSWTSATNGLASRMVLALAADPSAPETVYAGVDGGLSKSVDGGGSWTKLLFPGDNAYAVAVSPAQPNVVLAIAVKDGRGLVYRSEDGGATWGAGG
ncbi:MAG: WD40/YVTN/BNR-like repeat-containing protein [Dehalococcoidia bacterium]